MAINVPTTIELLDANQLLGAVPAGREPLETLLNRTNHLYAYHAPALVNVTFRDAFNPSSQFIVPIDPSVDGIDYDVAMSFVADAGTIAVTLGWSATYAGAYSSIAGWNANTITSAAPSATHIGAADSTEPAASIPASARFLSVSVVHATGDVQLHSLCITPRRMTSISSGAKASGFIAFDDGLLSSTGAPINTEHLNRGWQNITATYSDRRHWLMGQVFSPSAPSYRFTKFGYKGTHQYTTVGQVHMPGNVESVCKVRMRAQDSGTPASITIGQINGASVTLDANDTDHETDLTISGEYPVLFAMANPYNGIAIRYLSVTWAPSLGIATGFVTGAAPPARLEYLATLDTLSLQALATPYAVSLHSTDVDNSEHSFVYWHQPIAPGSRSMRQVVTRGAEMSGSTQKMSDSNVWGFNSGTLVGDRIDVPGPAGGTESWPPEPWAHVVHGSVAYDNSGSHAPGDERQWVLAELRTPYVERFFGANFVCVAGETTQVADLSAV
ncbi:MAG: hypothetical protein ACYTFV_02575 [Planctomycetota bacterium]|jgi:hypothetical protein